MRSPLDSISLAVTSFESCLDTTTSPCVCASSPVSVCWKAGVNFLPVAAQSRYRVDVFQIVNNTLVLDASQAVDVTADQVFHFT
jgi:hypothetical protein